MVLGGCKIVSGRSQMVLGRQGHPKNISHIGVIGFWDSPRITQMMFEVKSFPKILSCFIFHLYVTKLRTHVAKLRIWFGIRSVKI